MDNAAPDEGVDEGTPSPNREGGAGAEESRRSIAERTSSQASKVKADVDIGPNKSKAKQHQRDSTGDRKERKIPKSERGAERAEDAREKVSKERSSERAEDAKEKVSKERRHVERSINFETCHCFP